MSLEKLLALGAEMVAGTVFLNREEVGVFRNGQFMILPAGEAALVEPEPQQLPPPPEPPAPRQKKQPKEPKVETPPPAPQESSDPDLSGLDDLLNP